MVPRIFFYFLENRRKRSDIHLHRPIGQFKYLMRQILLFTTSIDPYFTVFPLIKITTFSNGSAYSKFSINDLKIVFILL